MSRIYLIRHGKPAAAWGEDDDPGLDATGAAQARAVAERLLDLTEGAPARAVVSSPLRRCRETAAPFAAAVGLDLQIDPRVGEIPTPAALTVAQRPAWLQAAFAGAWADIKGDLDYEAWRRGVAAALLARGDCAVFSHFVAINAVVSLIRDDPRVIAFRPDHVSLTILETDGSRLRLVELGGEAGTQVL